LSLKRKAHRLILRTLAKSYKENANNKNNMITVKMPILEKLLHHKIFKRKNQPQELFKQDKVKIKCLDFRPVILLYHQIILQVMHKLEIQINLIVQT
jgi:hypothetical protein